MCGRATTLKNTKLISMRLQIATDRGFENFLVDSCKIGSVVPVVRASGEGELVISPMLWGMIKDNPEKRFPNVRIETAERKPTFIDSFQERRCIFPVTAFNENGEWFSLDPDELHVFGLLGIWNTFITPLGNKLDTFGIMTTDAHGAVEKVHHRMPVFVHPNKFEDWIFGPTDELIPDMLRATETLCFRELRNTTKNKTSQISFFQETYGKRQNH